MNRKDMLIEADELIPMINNRNLRIYDATIFFFRKEGEQTAHETYQAGHIPGAAFFDHQQFSDQNSKFMYMVPSEAELAEQIGSIGISAEHEVIFYTTDLLPCATRAWWILRYAGHNHVKVLNGGLKAWVDAGGQTEQGDHLYESTRFQGDPRPEMFAHKEDVLKAMQNGQVCTVNTLTQESYDQAHIEGSSLLPCSDLMHEMASFLPNEQLEAQLQGEMGYDQVITYCGGGIAATVNGMAHLMVGNQNVAVYDGSMDEWGKEGLPMGND